MLGYLYKVFLVCGYVSQVKMGLTGVAEVIWAKEGGEGGYGGMRDEKGRPMSGSHWEG